MRDLDGFGEVAGADPLDVEPGDGFIDVLGAAEVGRQDVGGERLALLSGPAVEDARLLNRDRP